VKLVIAAKRRSYDVCGSSGQGYSADSTFDSRDADEIFREFFGEKDPFDAFFDGKGPFEAFFANSGKVLFRGPVR